MYLEVFLNWNFSIYFPVLVKKIDHFNKVKKGIHKIVTAIKHLFQHFTAVLHLRTKFGHVYFKHILLLLDKCILMWSFFRARFDIQTF